MHKIIRVKIYLGLFILFLISETILHRISLFGAMPELIPIFVIFFGLFYGIRYGVEVGIIAGLVQDVLSISVFGLNIVFLGLIGLITGSISDKVYRENYIGQGLITFVACLVVSKFNIFVSIYTAILAPVVFYLFEKIFKSSEIYDSLGNRI